ncbi:hypothetical protein ERJ75_001688100 [Trypanosoma vivax]|nr:hypothetical protein ERJ75_001688100 [Trypanosoma vivax]
MRFSEGGARVEDARGKWGVRDGGDANRWTGPGRRRGKEHFDNGETHAARRQQDGCFDAASEEGSKQQGRKQGTAARGREVDVLARGIGQGPGQGRNRRFCCEAREGPRHYGKRRQHEPEAGSAFFRVCAQEEVRGCTAGCSRRQCGMSATRGGSVKGRETALHDTVVREKCEKVEG